jgi:hypothetical protein
MRHSSSSPSVAIGGEAFCHFRKVSPPRITSYNHACSTGEVLKSPLKKDTSPQFLQSTSCFLQSKHGNSYLKTGWEYKK